MKVTLDTNVLYQALCSNKGASFAILSLIRSGRICLSISVPVFEEYKDVLNRPDFLRKSGLKRSDSEKILSFLAFAGHPFDIYFLMRPNLIDEDDNIFIELAFASNSSFLITSNVRDYKQSQLKFDSFKIITPSDFMRTWRQRHV